MTDERHERVRGEFERRGQLARRELSGQREHELQEAYFASWRPVQPAVDHGPRFERGERGRRQAGREVDREAVVLDPGEPPGQVNDDVGRYMALSVAQSALHQLQIHDELGGADVHQNARTPSAVVAVTRRHRDARPCCSARWKSTHWVAWRKHHSEDERDDYEPERALQHSREFGASAGEEKLPVVMEWACLARGHERGKEWSQQTSLERI